MRALVLALLCACWTGSPNVGTPPIVKAKPFPAKLPPTCSECWTWRMHEEMPIWPVDALDACTQRPHDEREGCQTAAFVRAFTKAMSWIERWFDACDPLRRGRR